MAIINKQMKTYNVPSGNDTVCYEIVDDRNRQDTSVLKGNIASQGIKKTDATPAAIMQIEDCGDGLPMAVQVAIDPVQDLHGYDNPWPAGGGKNMCSGVEQGVYTLSGTKTSSNTRVRCVSPLAVTAGQNYTVSAVNASGSGTIQIGFNIYSAIETERIANISWQSLPYTFVIPENGNYVTFTIRFSDDANIIPSDVSNVQFEAGQSATDYVPYSNICPITGWTGAKVTRTGKNLWDEEWEAGMLDISGQPASNNFRIRSKNYIPVKPGMQLRFAYPIETNSGLTLCAYNNSGAFLGNITHNSFVFTIPEKCAFIKFHVGNNTNPCTTYGNNISINYPNTDTEYHAYNGTTYSITFPSEAGTVYGGTLTVNKDGSGTLVVDRAIADLGDFSWNYASGGTTVPYFLADISAKESADGACSVYKRSTVSAANDTDKAWWILSNGINIRIRDTAFTDSETFTESVTGQKLVYELATPVTYTFTASQILSLLGINNIWADTGDVLQIDYTVDTKMYVDNKVAAAQKVLELIVTANREDEMKASKAYSSGDLLIVGGTLYKVSASIANGATLTVGTNVTATTVAAEIAALA